MTHPAAPFAPDCDREWLWGLTLIFAVVLVYTPVFWSGYIWDDPEHVTANPYVVGPFGVFDIWTSSEWRPFPLVITAFWVEHFLWGLSPLPYHLVNVLEHGACAVLLWRILIGLRVPGPWVGAALWALHPLQVESVAWISEMKNTQSCFFYLLCILFFVRWMERADDKKSGRWYYGLAFLWAVLAMLSKTSTLVLPVVLGLGAWWRQGGWRFLGPLAPFFLLSLIAGVLTIWPQKISTGQPLDLISTQTWPQRLATAGDAIWFYFGKLVWPYPLMTIYPRWQIDAENSTSYLPLLALMGAVLILWRKRQSWARPWFFAAVYFIVALSPFLTLVNQSFWRLSLVEDHLPYLASMGPLALAGTGLARLDHLVLVEKPRVQSTLCAGLLLVLGLLSWHRAWAYKSNETLWTDELSKNPGCWMGYFEIGNCLLLKGQTDEAIAQYKKALEIRPDDADADCSLGSALLQKGQVDEAIREFRRALEINPNFAEAQNDLGNILLQRGQIDEAVTHFEKAVEIKPNLAELYNSLGNALLQKGQGEEAIAHFEKALEINPNYAQAHYNLANILLQKGQVDEAIIHYEKALKIDPNYAEAHNNLGDALVEKGRLSDAIFQFQEAIRSDPKITDAPKNLAKIMTIIPQPTPAR